MFARAPVLDFKHDVSKKSKNTYFYYKVNFGTQGKIAAI